MLKAWRENLKDKKVEKPKDEYERDNNDGLYRFTTLLSCTEASSISEA